MWRAKAEGTKKPQGLCVRKNCRTQSSWKRCRHASIGCTRSPARNSSKQKAQHSGAASSLEVAAVLVSSQEALQLKASCAEQSRGRKAPSMPPRGPARTIRVGLRTQDSCGSPCCSKEPALQGSPSWPPRKAPPRTYGRVRCVSVVVLLDPARLGGRGTLPRSKLGMESNSTGLVGATSKAAMVGSVGARRAGSCPASPAPTAARRAARSAPRRAPPRTPPSVPPRPRSAWGCRGPWRASAGGPRRSWNPSCLGR
mmetsp:Transcript_121851/g.389663  ORF Transcript_121851/g.389663 Transcript_121851/m.389663 type:complete len:255 (+) Transcript_121851:451-1215(+)